MNDKELKENKDRAALAIKKAQGTTAKAIQMIEDDVYCPDVIQQIDAAIGLLRSSKKTLLIGHIDHCVEDNLKKNKPAAIKELIRIFDLK